MSCINQAFECSNWEKEYASQKRKEKEDEEKEMIELFEKEYPNIPFKELKFLYLHSDDPYAWYSHKTGTYYYIPSKKEWKKEFPNQNLKNSPSLAFIKVFGLKKYIINKFYHTIY